MSAKFSLKKGILPVVAGFLLSGFVIWWYLFLNPYISLVYREQTQMFLFSWDYFLRYLNLPGGLTSYLASFLVQFFHYRALGIMIYLSVFLCFYAVFKQVLEKFSLFKDSFLIAFIPGLLFLPASVHILFDLADELAVIIALYGFIILAGVASKRFYYFLIPLTVTVLYALVGGCVLISLTLFVLFSVFRQTKNNMRQIATGILSLLIPLILWYIFYMVSFTNACFALTHFRYPEARLLDSRGMAWLAAGVIPLIGLLFQKIRTGKKWMLFCDITLAVIILIVIVKQNRSELENNIMMGFFAENHQWENILTTHKKTSINPVSCYYTNLALQKTGQMAEKMFHYEQTGISGLFVEKKDYFSSSVKSDLFYQLGWINPAQQYAYESMIAYSSVKEPNIRNMKRLLDCAVVRQDSLLAFKYEKILNKTLFYKDYAKKQHYPPAIKMKNTIIQNIPALLESILEDNSKNQAVFEYLMAYYLLERDYEKAKNCFDRYFSNFSYLHIPTHYAEFLALYKSFKNLDDRFFTQYPISREIREQFDMMDMLCSSAMTKQIKRTLDDGFKNTYWYYVRFPLVKSKANAKKIQ